MFDDTIMAMIFAIPCIILIVAVVIRHVKGTLLVFLMVVMTDMGMIGVCYWTGQPFDFFFGLCVFLALGLTVDFNVHVIHRSLELTPNYALSEISDWEMSKDHVHRVMYAIGIFSTP